jgi:hypothetical protein
LNAAARNHAPTALASLASRKSWVGATLASDVVGGHRFGSNGALYDERLYRVVE